MATELCIKCKQFNSDQIDSFERMYRTSDIFPSHVNVQLMLLFTTSILLFWSGH